MDRATTRFELRQGSTLGDHGAHAAPPSHAEVRWLILGVAYGAGAVPAPRGPPMSSITACLVLLSLGVAWTAYGPPARFLRDSLPGTALLVGSRR